MKTDYAAQFPILGKCTYLSTAQAGILSQSVINWRREHDLQYMQGGSTFRVQQVNILETLRHDLAATFNADVAYTYLVPNLSFGVKVVLQGLKGPQRILTLEGDYPSITYPAASGGYEHVILPVTENLEEDIFNKIEANKPTIFAFSWVQYTNGLKMDEAFIKKLKTDFPELILITDATQYCGTEVFDFKASGVDVFIASGFKWLLGGYGNGFVFLTDAIARRLYVDVQQRPLPTEAFVGHKSALALQFEPGHLDTLNFGSLQQSLHYLNDLGIDYIGKEVRELCIAARKEFENRELLEKVVLCRAVHSQIFNLQIGEHIIQKIQQAGIVGTNRGNGFRVSFHFYNTVAELNKLMGVIDKHR